MMPNPSQGDLALSNQPLHSAFSTFGAAMLKKRIYLPFLLALVSLAMSGFINFSYANPLTKLAGTYSVDVEVRENGRQIAIFTTTTTADGRVYPTKYGKAQSYISGFTTTVDSHGKVWNGAISKEVFYGDSMLISLRPAQTDLQSLADSKDSPELVLDLDYERTNLLGMAQTRSEGGVVQLPALETLRSNNSLVTALGATNQLTPMKSEDGTLVQILAIVRKVSE